MLRNPVIATVNDFLRLLDIAVPRATVRSRLAGAPDFPFLGLRSLKAAFDEWGIDTVAVQAAPQEAHNLTLPAIVVLEERVDGADDRRSVFAILCALSRRRAEIVHPTLGRGLVAASDFFAQWSGIAFLAARPSWSGRRFREALRREAAAARDYRQSVQTLPDFLSEADCRHLIDHCESNGLFETSGVLATAASSGENDLLARTRTSESAFVADRADARLAYIYDRVSKLFCVSQDRIENLQCVRYRPGQEFKPHYDAGPDIDRTHTLLVYLNEGFEGGETCFPDLGLRVAPKTGTGLLFRNLDDDLQMIPDSLHAGLPVRCGVKYACNIWVRARPLGPA